MAEQKINPATPEEVLAFLDSRPSRKAESDTSELLELLQKYTGTILGAIKKTALDSYASRLFITDIPEFGALFRKGNKSLAHLDALREWTRSVLGDRVRVEGDPNFTGFYFAW